MEKKLALLGISGITVFLVSAVWQEFSSTFIWSQPIGKILIGYIVIAANTPWIYLVFITRKSANLRNKIVYFLGCWLLAPYFLIRLNDEEKNSP